MKALSSPVFLILMLLILLSILIPSLLILNSTPIYSSQGKIASTLYTQLQQQQQQQVFRGNPNIYYNSTKYPSIQFIFSSIPIPINITQIYYFNGNTWVPVLKNSIIVSSTTKLPLPPAAFNQPILMVTSEANFYFLNPNTSITTVTISGPAGKIPVYVTAFVLNGSKVIPISVQVALQGNIINNTPVIFYLNPGSYSIADKNSSSIFLPGYGLTATFQNWTIVGYGNLNSPSNSQGVTFTVSGPLVLTIVYKAVLQEFQVTIKPANIPLGTNIYQSISNGNNGNGKGEGSTTKITLTSLNTTIPVIVDNKLYQIPSSGITLTLTYGYHIIQFPSYYNITFNYTGGYFSKPVLGGEIICYKFTELASSISKISIVSSNEVFVNSSGTIYGNYQPYQSYYLVIIKNYFYFPSGVWAVKNSTPVNISIAGQPLQVNILGTDIVITLGNIENYVPQKIYFKQGTELNIQLDYLHHLLSLQGSFTIYQSNEFIQYVCLISYPINVTVFNVSSVNGQGYVYEPLPSLGNYGNIYINSPTIIINYQEWEYGVKPINGGG